MWTFDKSFKLKDGFKKLVDLPSLEEEKTFRQDSLITKRYFFPICGPRLTHVVSGVNRLSHPGVCPVAGLAGASTRCGKATMHWRSADRA